MKQLVKVLKSKNYVQPIHFDPLKCNSMFVIGCGHGRTGSTSLQMALQELGFNSYHSSVAATERGDHPLWHKSLDLKTNKLKQNNITSYNDWINTECILKPNEFDWDDIFQTKIAQKYNACVGVPSFPFCFDILSFYEQSPYNYDCKLILTQRQNEDIWFKSVSKSIAEVQQTINGHWFLKPVFGKLFFNIMQKSACHLWMDDTSNNSYLNEKQMKQHYIEWNKFVINTVPKDKLLIFNAGDGWEPLCKFLNVDIPDIPFPHSNESEQMQKFAKILGFIGYTANGVVIVFVCAAYYIFNKKT